MYILSQCQIFPRFYKKYCGGGVTQRSMLTLLGLVKEQARSWQAQHKGALGQEASENKLGCPGKEIS